MGESNLVMVYDPLMCCRIRFSNIQLRIFASIFINDIGLQFSFSVLSFSVFFFKSLLNLFQYCFCFMFWFFVCEACGILAPKPGIEPAPPALEGEILTAGPPEKSPSVLFVFFK